MFRCPPCASASPTCDGKTEPGAANVRGGARSAIERVKDLLAFARVDTNAPIGNRDVDPRLATPRADGNWRIRRRVLRGILEEIDENSKRVTEVEATDEHVGVAQLDVDPVRTENGRGALERGSDHVIDRIQLDRDRQRSRIELRQLKRPSTSTERRSTSSSITPARPASPPCLISCAIPLIVVSGVRRS